MLDGRWRGEFERRIRPVAANLRDVGLTADGLTVVGLVMAGATAVAIGAGALRAAVLLLLLTALPDVLDGAVAKASGTASPRGAFFDSVIDRVADALILGGVAWFLVGSASPYVVLLPFAVLATTMLISYERAKAESLGFQARGGLMERAERMILLGLGLLFDSLLVPVLWLLLALTLVTAVQRFARVWRQASHPVTSPSPVLDRWRQRRRLTRTTSARAWRVGSRARAAERRRPPRA